MIIKSPKYTTSGLFPCLGETWLGDILKLSTRQISERESWSNCSLKNKHLSPIRQVPQATNVLLHKTSNSTKKMEGHTWGFKRKKKQDFDSRPICPS